MVPPTTEETGPWLRRSGAQGCLVLPTAPVLQDKAACIVMQHVREDE